MLTIVFLLTLGVLAVLWVDRRPLGEAPRRERWICLGIAAGCYLMILIDMLFPHSFAISPLLERAVTALFPQAAG